MQKRIKEHVRTIAKIIASRSPQVKKGLPAAYGRLLDRVAMILDRAKALQKQAESCWLVEQLNHWIKLTEQVCDTAYRRFFLQEHVPNNEKLFSLFETHTQLYRRGKAGTPNQFGRQVLVCEDLQLKLFLNYKFNARTPKRVQSSGSLSFISFDFFGFKRFSARH